MTPCLYHAEKKQFQKNYRIKYKKQKHKAFRKQFGRTFLSI